jgi:hypothetical protein
VVHIAETRLGCEEYEATTGVGGFTLRLLKFLNSLPAHPVALKHMELKAEEVGT